MNTHLLNDPEWLEATLVKEEWDEMRLAVIFNGKLIAVLPMGIDPPMKKQPARCLLWLRTHSGQTSYCNQVQAGRPSSAADIRAPKSIFLSRLAAESIRPKPENAWHEAEYQLILPETENISSLR